MNRQEALQPNRDISPGGNLKRNPMENIVRTFQGRLPPWFPGGRSEQSSTRGKQPDDLQAEDTSILNDPLQNPDLELESKRSQIANILYGSPPPWGEGKSPIVYKDMRTIREWRQDPRVFGHIYPRIKDDPEAEGELQRVSHYEYYLGTKDADGNERDQKDAVFFKAVNGPSEMLAVGSLILNGVPFILQGRRIAYMEQVMRAPNPEYEDQKIGTALAVEILDYAFYRCTRYQGGRSAVELRASTIVDRAAGAFNINELWLRGVGFKHDGNVILVRDTPNSEIPVQPWKITLPEYEAARPRAVGSIRLKQPEWADRLERIWPDLQHELKERTARLPEGRGYPRSQDQI